MRNIYQVKIMCTFLTNEVILSEQLVTTICQQIQKQKEYHQHPLSFYVTMLKLQRKMTPTI